MSEIIEKGKLVKYKKGENPELNGYFILLSGKMTTKLSSSQNIIIVEPFVGINLVHSSDYTIDEDCRLFCTEKYIIIIILLFIVHNLMK